MALVAAPVLLRKMSGVGEKREVVDEERAKLLVEFSKHLFTLAVATALAILAIYMEAAAESFVAWIPLALFGVSLVLSVIVMAMMAIGIRDANQLHALCIVTGVIFIFAVLLFALFAIQYYKYIESPIVAGVYLVYLIFTIVVCIVAWKHRVRPPPGDR